MKRGMRTIMVIVGLMISGGPVWAYHSPSIVISDVDNNAQSIFEAGEGVKTYFEVLEISQNHGFRIDIREVGGDVVASLTADDYHKQVTWTEAWVDSSYAPTFSGLPFGDYIAQGYLILDSGPVHLDTADDEFTVNEGVVAPEVPYTSLKMQVCLDAESRECFSNSNELVVKIGNSIYPKLEALNISVPHSWEIKVVGYYVEYTEKSKDFDPKGDTWDTSGAIFPIQIPAHIAEESDLSDDYLIPYSVDFSIIVDGQTIKKTIVFHASKNPIEKKQVVLPPYILLLKGD